MKFKLIIETTFAEEIDIILPIYYISESCHMVFRDLFTSNFNIPSPDDIIMQSFSGVY